MKKLMVILSAVAFAVTGSWALAQSTQPSPSDADKAAAKAQKKADFAKKQQEMQQQSTSSASGSVAGADTNKATPKTRPGGKAGMQAQIEMQRNKPSKPVDKNAKASSPQKDIRTMTPEERAEARKEIVKEAKP